MKKIGYADFVQILQLDETDEWLPGHILKPDGVYVTPPDARLTAAEKAALSQHSTGNLSEPTLRFPCTASEMQAYLAFLGDPVVDQNLREWISSCHSPIETEPANHPDKNYRTIADLIEALCKTEGYNPKAVWQKMNNILGSRDAFPLAGFKEGEFVYHGTKGHMQLSYDMLYQRIRRLKEKAISSSQSHR